MNREVVRYASEYVELGEIDLAQFESAVPLVDDIVGDLYGHAVETTHGVLIYVPSVTMAEVRNALADMKR